MVHGIIATEKGKVLFNSIHTLPSPSELFFLLWYLLQLYLKATFWEIQQLFFMLLEKNALISSI